MMKLKRIAVLVLTIAIVTSMVLSGCGTQGSEKAETSISKTDEQVTTTAEQSKLDEVTLKYYFGGTWPQPEQDAVFAEVNKKVKEKINANIEFMPIGWAEYDNKMKLIISSNEDYDICFTGNWINNYNQNVAKGAFLALDDLLIKYAPKAYAAVPTACWEAARINGKIYGFINQQIFARTPAITVEKAIADKYGLDTSNIKAGDIKQFEPFIEKVFKDSPEKLVMPGLVGMNGEFFNLDLLQDYTCPGAVDVDDTSVKVINQFESPKFLEFAQTMREWNKKGWLHSKEMLVNKTYDTVSLFKDHKIIWTIGGAYKPGGAESNSTMYGYQVYEIPAGAPIVTTGGVVATMNAVSLNSKNPERAMMFLELINTDQDTYMTLNYGIKDKHFTIDSDGFLVKDGEDAQKYNPNVPWMFATNFLSVPFKGSPKTVWEDTAKLNDTSKKSPLLGFALNTEPIKAEIAKCSAVYNEYAKIIDLGLADEAKYNEFLQKLKAAGSDKIVSEMQKQVDTFKASK